VLASLVPWSLPWGQSGRRERYFNLQEKWVKAASAHPGAQEPERASLADLDAPAAFAAEHDELLEVSSTHQLERVDKSIPLPERYALGVEARVANDRIVESLERRARTPEELDYVARLKERSASRTESWRAYNALLEASRRGFVEKLAATKPPHGHKSEFAALVAAHRSEMQAVQAFRIAAEGTDRETARHACEAWLTTVESVADHEKALYGAAYPRSAHTRD
jgi:hypothetical protein